MVDQKHKEIADRLDNKCRHVTDCITTYILMDKLPDKSGCKKCSMKEVWK